MLVSDSHGAQSLLKASAVIKEQTGCRFPPLPHLKTGFMSVRSQTGERSTGFVYYTMPKRMFRGDEVKRKAGEINNKAIRLAMSR